MTTLYIKNMVCDRCVRVVKSIFEEAGLQPVCVHIGEVVLLEEPDKVRMDQVSRVLAINGLSVLKDKKLQTVEAIKSSIIELIHRSADSSPLKYADYLAQRLAVNYSTLSSLFSEIENTTIEHFIILQKIERIKELLVYNEFSISQIADELGYSSAQYLANQFKQLTGMTPSQFRRNNQVRRRSLDQLLDKHPVTQKN